MNLTIDDVVDWQFGTAPDEVRRAIERDLARGDESLVREYIDWSSGRRRGTIPRLMREDMDSVPPETRRAWLELGDEPGRAPAPRGPDEIVERRVVPVRFLPLIRERYVRRLILWPSGFALAAGLIIGLWLGFRFCSGDEDPRHAGKGTPRSIGAGLLFYPPRQCVRSGGTISFRYTIENVGDEPAQFTLNAGSLRAYDEGGREYRDYGFGLGSASDYVLRYQGIRIAAGERVPGHVTFGGASPSTELLTIHFHTRPEVGTFIDVPVADREPTPTR